MTVLTPGHYHDRVSEPAAATPPPADNPAALLGEAMTKSGIMWIEIPGDRAWPAWYAWNGETAYVLNGPGEQHLPWLPPEVTIILRSKDTWARLLRVKARAEVLNPKLIEYAPAVEALAAKRLNARPDAEAAWQAECTVTALRPDPQPLEAPGSFPDTVDLAPAPTSDAATSGWRPFHVRGRSESMRARRMRRRRG